MLKIFAAALIAKLGNEHRGLDNPMVPTLWKFALDYITAHPKK